MGIVTIIPAKHRIGSRIVNDETPKMRVAAYCRVSTDTEEQATSYEAQVQHYTEFIKKNPVWEYAGIYADDGISGTNTKKREEFNRLIKDCLDGKIDLVITKSISRFARNTLDCLNYIRKLKEKNIAVFFEKEGINTLDAKGEVMLTIMASLAQQESESLSQNVRLGIQYRYQQGKVFINHSRFLGYDKDDQGNLIINKEEAEIIKRIYREYLEGQSYYSIGKGLERDRIKTAAGGERWHSSSLKLILTNEKYMGDALLQKTITTDFLNKKRTVNNGVAPQYYVENNHEAIIPRELFMLVQEEMVKRTSLETPTGKKRIYSGKFALSNLVTCAHCGEFYQRTHWNIHGRREIVWRCLSRLNKKDAETECCSITVKESQLQEAVVKAINSIFAKHDILEQLKKNIDKALKLDNTDAIKQIDQEIEELQKELITKIKQHKNYDNIGDKIESLRDKKYQLQLDVAQQEGKCQKLKDLQAFLDEQETQITTYDDNLTKRLIEHITVYDDHFVVEFKSTLKVEIKI